MGTDASLRRVFLSLGHFGVWSRLFETRWRVRGCKVAMGNDDDMAAERADRAYAVHAALAEAWPTDAKALSVSTLATRLLTGAAPLTAEECGAVARDPKLKASLAHIRNALRIAQFPRLAAASHSRQLERRFAEGAIAIVPSRKPGLVLVKVTWTPTVRVPRLLMLESGTDAAAIRALGELHPSGCFVVTCDERSAEDRAYLELLADPRTSGTFLG